MAQRYASIIIDISHENVDRTFQYKIPEELQGKIQVGQQVYIPFGQGNRQRKGYVVELTDQAQIDVHKLKDVAGIVQGSVAAESQLIWLAWWMKERYGSTMNQALKTVLPVKQKVREAPKRRIRSLVGRGVLEELAEEAGRKKHKAKLRLLEALLQNGAIPYEEAMNRLSLTATAIKPLLEAGIIAVEVVEKYRNPLEEMKLLMGGGDRSRAAADNRAADNRATDNRTAADSRAAEGTGLWGAPPDLNPFQQEIADAVTGEYDRGIRRTYLLHGVTGSGKTEVYMELIAHVLGAGRQVIVLIPEISLTWQTVMRFYSRFGNRVSVMNSRMSAGERYDQYERARTGDIDIVIGPRSALFAPFENLGLIIIDEEHENAYKSELSPRYDAREAAARRARMNDASLVMGSATPSLESYTRALRGEYGLFTLKERAKEDACLPQVEIVDLREELKEGNRSIFSRRLKALIEERLEKREQVMLFINRRGYANFVSCRSCGEAMRCPHCDVTLTLHRNGQMMCHYCGYSQPLPPACPDCGGKLNFIGVGTQKVQEELESLFPGVEVLRMDTDTISASQSHETLLSRFEKEKIPILVGTQMVAKGLDFENVTLVGVIAADLALYVDSFRAAERTFSLLTQVVGRAGRGGKTGRAVIQTYTPDNDVIRYAASQDYDSFFEQEIDLRKLMEYPPFRDLFVLTASGLNEASVLRACQQLRRSLERWIAVWPSPENRPRLLGPAPAAVAKVNHRYRYRLTLMCQNTKEVRGLLAQMLRAANSDKENRGVSIFADVNPYD